MMKFSTKYGDMFSCGWLPPVAVTHAGFIAVVKLGSNGLELLADQRFPAAPGEVGGLVELPVGVWACAGNSEMLSVWEVSPPISPRTMPLPTCKGERPCRLGRPKVVCPFPP